MKNPRTTITKQGFHVLKEDTHISRWVEEHGSLVCDPHLFKWLLPKIAGARVLWDLGAFIGDHTLAYLEMPGVEKVYAFEPNPDAFYCLERNVGEMNSHLVELNGNARCYNVAASDRKEKLSFQANPNAGASKLADAGGNTVQAVVLDKFMQGTPPPDFIKIDIEGFEVRALTGMINTLHTARPKVFVEINTGALDANGHTYKDVFDVFAELGYATHRNYPERIAFDEPQYDVLFLP